jgi:hypothetical protein
MCLCIYVTKAYVAQITALSLCAREEEGGLQLQPRRIRQDIHSTEQKCCWTNDWSDEGDVIVKTGI